MTQQQNSSNGPVALIVGAGPGVSAACARRFHAEGFRVVLAARNPNKPPLLALKAELGIECLACDASKERDVEALFSAVERDYGTPALVVHNIDGRTMEIFRKPLVEAEAEHVAATLERSALSAFLVAQQTARSMLKQPLPPGGQRGTLIITNASAALKGYPNSAAFAMACHAKAGLAQSMARELMPQGIHVAHVPIDAAVALQGDDGSRAHWSGAAAEEDNMAYPEHIAEVYLQLHRQHRSTWAFEVVLRPWQERW